MINDEERSFEIYRYQEKISGLDMQIMGKEQLDFEKSSLLKEEKKKLVIQHAAKHFSMIKEKKSSIAQLKQRLENASKDREKLLKEMNKVAYTLKILYGRDLDKLRKEKFEAQSSIDRLRKERDEVTEESLRLDRESDDLNQQKGRFEEKIKIFKDEEKNIFEKLGIDISRNPFLGELDKAHTNDIKTKFEENYNNSDNLLKSTRQDDLDLKEKIEKLSEEVQIEKDKETGLKLEREKVLSAIGDYETDRNRLEKILRRLNIGLEYIFDKDHISKYCKDELNDWENKVFNLRMEIGEIEKRIKSFEKGVSYLPMGLVMKMEEMNLPCYTGEMFLTEVDDERRIELVKKNPFLPYALIATQKEIDAIEQLVRDLELSQIVPVIHVNHREKSFDADFESIRFVTGAKKMYLDTEGLKVFMSEMNQKSEEKKQALSSALEVVNRLTGQYTDIISFRWTKMQAEELERKSRDIDNEIKKNNIIMKSMFEEIKDLGLKRESLSAEIEKLRDKCNEHSNRVNLFEEYLKKNGEYEHNVHLYNLLQGDIEKHIKAKERCKKEKNKLDDEINDLKTTTSDAANRISLISDKLLQVDMSKEDELCEGDVSILEGKLRAYKNSQTGEIEDIKERMEGLHRDIAYHDEAILNLKPDSQEYMHIIYSENVKSQLEEQCNRLNSDITALKDEISDLRVKKEGITGRMDELRKAFGEREIIPVEEIRGEFSKRRISNRQKKEEIIDKKGDNEKEERIVITNIAKIETEIKDIGDIPYIQTVSDYTSIKALITNYLKEYGELRQSADERIGFFRKRSSEFSALYIQCDSNIVNQASKKLKESFDEPDRSYEKYFHLTEKMDAFLNKLKEVLKIVENKIQQLELSRNDLTEHAFMEARRIYREIPKISENSAVEIDGVRKKVLEILYDEMGDELQAKEKMSVYIKESLDTITAMIKDREDESKMRREIEKFMSTKELLNIISNLEMCKIRAYKVDLNEKNRSMMLWEDIIVKNSGGEKFVAYFSLLVALISYSRKQARGYEPFGRTRETKVLIMDNPFGPITSGHLLKPMFDIARKYDTQLICLSDIRQGSVLNSFDLIYMIKIRQNMNMEDYLELEPVMQKELKDNEKLENSYFYHKEKQISLFE